MACGMDQPCGWAGLISAHEPAPHCAAACYLQCALCPPYSLAVYRDHDRSPCPKGQATSTVGCFGIDSGCCSGACTAEERMPFIVHHHFLYIISSPTLPAGCRRGSSVHPAPGSAPAAKRTLKRDSPDMFYTTLPFALWSTLVSHVAAAHCQRQLLHHPARLLVPAVNSHCSCARQASSS